MNPVGTAMAAITSVSLSPADRFRALAGLLPGGPRGVAVYHGQYAGGASGKARLLWSADGGLQTPVRDLWRCDPDAGLPFTAAADGMCHREEDPFAGTASAGGAARYWWFPLEGANRGLLLTSAAGQAAEVTLDSLFYLVHLLVMALERDAAFETIREGERKCREQIQQIASIQEALLPREDLTVPGARILAYFETAVGAGGDYYDVVALGPGEGGGARWGAMIADAAGHGPGAAVEVAMLDAILRTYQGTVDAGPGEVLTYANRYLFTRRIRASFITAFIVNYDPDRGALHYANAGHPPAVIKSGEPGGTTRLLDEPGGIPLGVHQDALWEYGTAEMRPGDLVVLYTDGVTEVQSPEGEQFGVQRFLDAVAAARPDLEGIRTSVCEAVEAHTRGQPPADDQTLLIMQAVANGDDGRD